MRKSGDVATLAVPVNPTHGDVIVPRPPVSEMMGHPSVTAWPHLEAGIAYTPTPWRGGDAMPAAKRFSVGPAEKPVTTEPTVRAELPAVTDTSVATQVSPEPVLAIAKRSPQFDAWPATTTWVGVAPR